MEPDLLIYLAPGVGLALIGAIAAYLRWRARREKASESVTAPFVRKDVEVLPKGDERSMTDEK